MLKEGEFRNAEEIWTYETGDTGLVFNLTIAECEGLAAADNSASLAPSGSIGDRKMSGASGSYGASMLGLQRTSSGRLPAFTLPKETGIATMEGDLVDMPVSNLLQSCSMGKMTGRLLVHNNAASAQLFFDEGVLVHATADGCLGDDVILELVAWESGKFYFYREQKTDERSVKRRLDGMLMEGLTLLDQSRTLVDGGLTMDSYVDKRNKQLTEAEFEKLVASGAPVDKNLQKAVYLSVDGLSNLGEILRQKGLVKKEWVPILYNLLKADLLTLSAKSAQPDKTSLLVPTAIDRVAIDAIEKSFRRPDTGLISYPHFQFTLEQEFARCQLYRTQFSVIVIDLWRQQGAAMSPVPTSALKVIFERVEGVKRKLDVLAHFEALSYAMLLPHTETAAAAILAYRIREVLLASAMPDLPLGQLSLACGIAGMPEDCRDPAILLSAAKASKQAAQMNSTPLVLFKDLQKLQA
jgi:GGDEF domain-containing protein